MKKTLFLTLFVLFITLGIGISSNIAHASYYYPTNSNWYNTYNYYPYTYNNYYNPYYSYYSNNYYSYYPYTYTYNNYWDRTSGLSGQNTLYPAAQEVKPTKQLIATDNYTVSTEPMCLYTSGTGRYDGFVSSCAPKTYFMNGDGSIY